MGTWDDIVDKNAPPPYWFEPKEKDEDELPDRRTRRRIEQHGLRQRLVRVLGAFREDCTVPGLKLVHPKTGQATTWRIHAPHRRLLVSVGLDWSDADRATLRERGFELVAVRTEAELVPAIEAWAKSQPSASEPAPEAATEAEDTLRDRAACQAATAGNLDRAREIIKGAELTALEIAAAKAPPDTRRPARRGPRTSRRSSVCCSASDSSNGWHRQPRAVSIFQTWLG